MRRIKFHLSSVLIILAVASSCKKNAATPDCGCDGPTLVIIENTKASYLGDGYFVIDKMDQYGHLISGLTCDVDTIWEKSTDPSNFNYIVSGNLKRRCRSIDDATTISLGSPLQITSIRKN